MRAFILLVSLTMLPCTGLAQQGKAGRKPPSPAQKKAAAKRVPTPEPAGPAKFPVEAVRVTGSKLYKEADIVRAAGVRIGVPLEDRQLDEARDRLVLHGAFANVGYKYEPAPSNRGYVVTFEVVDYEQLFPMRFERLNVDEAKLRAWLKEKEPLFGDRISAADPVLARYRGRVAEFLKSNGQAIELSAKVAADGPNQLHVLFAPAGRLPAVAEVYFEGNKVIQTSTLQNTIHAVAVGTEFREDRFQELLNTSIRPLYESRGRLAVAFPSLKTKDATGVKGVAVTVTVDEGPSYSFGEISVEGTPGLEKELLKAAAVTGGEVASIDVIQAGQLRIEQAMKRNGHMSVSTTVSRQLDAKEKTADFTFQVTPGPRFTMGRLFVQGLDLHGEPEVRRIWTLKQGQPFNAEYPDYFLNRLREDGVFDNLKSTRAVVKPNEKDLTVDVQLIFNEPKPKTPSQL